jgi:antitoxin ParD1/3/4
MTVKTTLSFTDRHAAFLKTQVEAGVFATTSAAVAAAIEAQLRAEEERLAERAVMREELARRLATPEKDMLTVDETFRIVRERIAARRAAAA